MVQIAPHNFSLLVAEVFSFADTFDEVLSITHTIEMAIANSLLLNQLTDPKSLCDIISKCSRTNEKWLMFDVYPSVKALTNIT